jgi:uncharacterized protein YjiS (DUF1127 family)
LFPHDAGAYSECARALGAEFREINVTTHAIRHPEAAVLHSFALLLRAGAHRVSAAALELDAWLEARRLAADAWRDLSEMSERELRDIGLDRADLGAVVKGGSPRTVEERVRALTFDASMRS